VQQPFAPRATLDEVITMLSSGRLDEAEQICRQAVQRNSKDVNMVALLGAVLVKTRQPVEAERYLRRAISLVPSFAKPYEDLGRLLVERKRPKDAVPVLEKAVYLDPKMEAAHFALGQALAMLGKGREADESFEKAFALNPKRKALAVAARHHKEGRLEEAERAYRAILRKDPDDVNALRLLGLIAFSAGRFDDAEELLRRSLSLAPDFLNAVIDLGRVLQEAGRLEQAIEAFRRATELAPNSAQAHFLLAAALAPAALTYESVEAYQRTIEIRPKHAPAWLGLGHVLKTVGRQAEAIEAYRRCIDIKPDNGEIYWSLANLKTFKLTDEDISAMQARIGTEDIAPQSRVNFLFALGKAYEDRQDYDRAWNYYRQGNSTQRMRERYDPVQTEIGNDAIIEVFTREFLAEKTGLGHPDPSPIFVVGLPRSGSTLLEQILASHSQVEGTSELPYLGRLTASLNRNRADGINYPQAVRELGGEHFRALGEEYLERAKIHRVEGAAHFIDKMPNNFPVIGFLHLVLPNAKIIDARRYPLDACLSCYRQLFAKGQSFTYDLTDIGLYYLEYQRLMDHWHEVLPGSVLTVQYEEVVAHFEDQVRRVLEYCELPWEDACINFHQTDRPIRTASSEQVRQPIYTSAINYSRHYQQHLDELIEVLEPVLERYQEYGPAGTGGG
jgi:tetratricopeptide (TPR) repeat protein